MGDKELLMKSGRDDVNRLIGCGLDNNVTKEGMLESFKWYSFLMVILKIIDYQIIK